MKLRLWPRSLAARTAVVLLTALAFVQVAGLTIHAFDRVDLLRLAQIRDIGVRVMSLYRSIALVPPQQRDAAVQDLDLPDGPFAALSPDPPTDEMMPAPPWLQRQLQVDMQLVPIPQRDRPRDMVFLGGPDNERLVAGLRLQDGRWLNMAVPMPPPRPWDSVNFLVAFLLMSATAVILVLWAVRRLTHPVTTLAQAAEALGRDVNAPPLPQTGPEEVATAAAAFNTMAARIRRFVQDRTLMLTAIGHDLRTPITRMRLRSEFIEDDELRRKMLSDLSELEAMVSATLAFGRDATAGEAVSALDLAELARTVLDEAADTHPDHDLRLGYRGPEHLPVQVRPVLLKRALTNLVQNAVAYGGCARITLLPPEPPADASPHAGPMVTLEIDDDGPGIPPGDIERMFQPFQRMEASRNRETGGFGLGLSIARDILHAHGGDVKLANRPGGGARATVTLPV
jgi:signal transduction histidine kinase